jgi:heme oxygenase
MLRSGVPVSPVLQALRDATADIHTAVETDADVEARLRDSVARPLMVARFHVLHSAVEAAISPWRPAFAEVGYAPDRRAPLIRAGLDRLGEAAPDDVPVAPLPTFGEAIGWVYVAEGSMLGGRVMQRGMIRDGIALTGLDFLDPHGDETGSRWRAFMSAMDSAYASGRATQADIVKGGRDAFDLALRLLVHPARVNSA